MMQQKESSHILECPKGFVQKNERIQANLPILGKIPRSVRASEITRMGTSIFSHDPHGKVAAAYEALAGRVFHQDRVDALGLEVCASA